MFVAGPSTLESHPHLCTRMDEHSSPMGRYLGPLYFDDTRANIFQIHPRLEYTSGNVQIVSYTHTDLCYSQSMIKYTLDYIPFNILF